LTLHLDFLFLLIFGFVQFRVSVAALRLAKRRLSGARLQAAKAGVFVFDGLLLIGYALSISDVAARLHAPGNLSLILGAGTLAYLITASAVWVLYSLFLPLRRRLSPPVDSGRRQVLNAAFGAVLAAPFAAMAYGFVSRTDFHVKEIDLPVPGLPVDLEGLRILQISDIHLSAFLSEVEFARAIDASLELHPHLTVITGDLISSRGDPLDGCIRQLARLKADAGVFGCMGNHERYARCENYTKQAAARVGIRFLRMEAQPLRFGESILNLAGVDHQSLAGKQLYLRGAEKLIAPGAVNLLLSHNPDVFPVAARQGYNLMLAGHTHGGQVTVEILDQAINPARFFTPYVYGLYRRGAFTAYVTRGIGTIGIPARIGAPPEISLLRLRKA
jgi:predicted MPP superfamily phosphohydrolase